MPQPFHLAIPVHDLGAARGFYGELFGCPEGRSSDEWVDFDFFGHQVVAHLDPGRKPAPCTTMKWMATTCPCRTSAWSAMGRLACAGRAAAQGAARASSIEPGIRFAGQVGEQATMFLYDPSGNALEFKAFKDPVAPVREVDGTAARAGAQRQAHQFACQPFSAFFGSASAAARAAAGLRRAEQSAMRARWLRAGRQSRRWLP